MSSLNTIKRVKRVATQELVLQAEADLRKMNPHLDTRSRLNKAGHIELSVSLPRDHPDVSVRKAVSEE